MGETVQVDIDELFVDRSDLLVFDEGGKVINSGDDGAGLLHAGSLQLLLRRLEPPGSGAAQLLLLGSARRSQESRGSAVFLLRCAGAARREPSSA